MTVQTVYKYLAFISMPFIGSVKLKQQTLEAGRFMRYEGQSKITEPYPITFESSKMDIYLDDISL